MFSPFGLNRVEPRQMDAPSAPDHTRVRAATKLYGLWKSVRSLSV
jgi:hypothetical protein